jgi:hypothetical protein
LPKYSTHKATRAFARGIQRDVFLENEFAGLKAKGPIPPPSWP